MSPLHDACRNGDTERVKQLLDGDGGARVDKKDEYGNTALIVGSTAGHTEVVRLLLDKGALLDEKDKYGRTAFGWTIARGNTAVMTLLLDKGALDKGDASDSDDYED
jgi:ankyrin repeat protein